MVLHLDKEHALLEWVNHLNVDLPVRSINDLQDGILLMKLVYKLRKEEPAKSYLDQHVQERLKVVSDFLQGDCRCSTERGALISWDNISNGLNLEVELSKVLVLLYYHSVINNHVDLNQLEYKFEVELASMLRFVLDNENSLYLSENLEKYLRKKPLFSFNSDISSTSSSSLFNDESPVFHRRKKIGSVQFLDLQTVASSSVSSPLQDVMNTPQFQLKKLQRQLRQERDMRDELEKDLTTSATTLTQRESQICQLQHRIEKLLREQAEQEQEPRDELQELHSKNEGLRTRLHEVLKECQALKTNSSQMERKVDSLTEENGTLSAQMREVIARLASAEAEVDRLTEAQDSAQGEWSSRHCHLQAELNQATAQKECLSEQMLILQSKISSLEDELSKAKMQEKGEVMGPILEWEQLKQELADATLRHAECECTIARLKGEKEQAATLHAQERASLQAESQRLQVLVTELQEALIALRADREALELASKEERESLTAQLHTLTAEVASLTQTVQQREQEVKALGEEVQQECMQRGELNLAMERQEREAREEIQELTSHVDTMGASLRKAEEEVQVREKQLTRQQQESALQREVLQEEMAASEKALKELKEQEEAVREEATRLHQEITTHATDLCSLRQEHTALQEQLARQQEEISLEKEAQSAAHREKEAVKEELSQLQDEVRSLGEQMAQLEEAQREKERLLLQSTENIETLQTERAAASSLAEAKDLELSSLREEVRAREEQLAMQQEEYRLQQEELQEELAAQENEISNMRERLAGLMDQISLLKEVCQEGKNMEALREEHTAQLEQLRLVKEQVEEVQERNEETSAALREKESSLREKEESLRRLEEELQSTTSLASQRRQEELTSLKEEVISLQEGVERRRAAEALAVEEAREVAREQESKRMELEESVSALQQQLDSAIQDNDMKRQKCERLEQDLEQRGTRVEELRQQEDGARLEATRLHQEISTHLSHLEVVQRGKEELARQQEELRGEVSLHQQRASVLQQSLEEQEIAMRVLKEQTESTREEATVKMEALQAQLEVVSSLAAAKDLQLSTLREEATALQEQLAKREQEISLQKEVLQEAQGEKESVEALREELARQQEELREELVLQQQRAQSLEQSLEEQQEALKELTVKEERAREEATQLRQEISTHLSRLEEVQRGKEELREQEGKAREETTVKMEALQAQLEVVSSLAAAKDLQLSTLREEASLLCQENTKRAADLKDVQWEKIRMESLLNEEHRALQEELAKEQEELRGQVSLHQQRAAELQQSLEKKQEALRELKEQLVQQQEDSSLQKDLQEAQAAALQEEVVDALRREMTLHQQRASVLQQSLEEQEVAIREQEEKSTEEATLKMEALRAAKDLQLSTLTEKATTLQEQLAKREQEISLQTEALQEAHMEKESVEALREELARQQEELVLQQQRAQSLEQSLEEQQEALKELTVKEERARKEATLKMVALQAAKDLELSTLRQEATQLRQEISTHVSHLEEVKSEGPLREEHTALQEQLAKQQEDSSLQKDLQEAQAAALQEEVVDALRREVTLHQQRASVLQQSLEEQEVAMREQEERARQEATLKMEALQAAKDMQLSTMTEKATTLQEQLAKREQEISLQTEALQEARMEKESVETLREELARQQEELVLQQQRAQSLEQSLEEQQEALKELTVKEERARKEATLKMVALQAAKDLELSTLRQEATQLRQEISTHVSHLEEVKSEGPLREEHTALQEQLAKQQEDSSLQKDLQEAQAAALQEEVVDALRREVTLHQQRASVLQQSLEEQEVAMREQEERARQEATLKMEALQAAKDMQLSTMTEKATTLQEQLAKREQEISLQTEALQEARMEKESVETLREELARQQEELREELVLQQQRAQSLEQSLEEQQEALKEKTVKEERARKEATLKMVALQAAKDLELSTLRQEATQLRQEISTHVSHLEEVKSEGPLREEHTALQEQLAKQQEENSLQKELLQEVQATVLQEREAKEALRGEVSLHQQRSAELLQSLEEQKVAMREDLVMQKEEGQAAGQVEKEALLTRALQAEQNQSELEGSMAELRAQAESRESGQRQQLDALLLDKERLTEGNQVLEMKCSAAQRLEAVLQAELALLTEQMEGTELEKQVRDLREQLAANTEVVDHYKTQVEKAKSHYSGKKQQLVESQEQVTELQRSLEVREHEVNAVTTEMKLLQKELEKTRSKEKSLSSKVNTLEAQLAFADRHLREQSQVRPEGGPGRIEKMRGGRESVYLKVPQSQTHQETSGDSLDLSLDDSLNTTTRPLRPDESSTPLVRSSERVAAKRRALGGDSLETLYFTPMNNRQISRSSTERRLEGSITSLGELALDSARKRPPTSSARRRRTTQVINITMSKKTPGRGGAGGDSDNETFYSLASVRSHPNITGRTHTARPVSMEIFHTPGEPAVALSDQLLSLPGYRRSTVHVAAPQSTGQFCVGAENEPEHAADDWLRIAELQARNQSCLPHLKSSYPLESRPSLGPSFEFTDDDLRMGDPTETIRRASVMPGQIQESLSSHRLSLHPGPADSTTATRPAYGSHRLSLMPPKPKASSTLNNQNTHNLRGSNLSLKRSAKDQEPDTPEAKRMATSCFPRPLTPKGGRFSSSNNRQPLSPAERRQSMVFSIDNTPRKAASKSGFLQRGMSKIRSSTRKSPGNKSSRVPRSGDGKSPRSGAGSVKSPQPGGKAQRKSPRTNSIKSPVNPTSTRKMNFRRKM